jgi:hypothetical protein
MDETPAQNPYRTREDKTINAKRDRERVTWNEAIFAVVEPGADETTHAAAKRASETRLSRMKGWIRDDKKLIASRLKEDQDQSETTAAPADAE